MEEKEFEEVKEKLNTIVPVTPVDTGKPLFLYTDASNSGLGWVLTQPRSKEVNINENWNKDALVIEMGSSSLSDCQSRYSPVEKELLAVVTAVSKLDYF